MKKVILISGKARSGKDTFAQMLQSIMVLDNQKPILLHYADILKYFCKQYLGWNGEKDEAGRTLLQYFGTDVVRNNHQDCWVNIIKELVNGIHTEYDYVLIPDTRFPNECDWRDTGFDFDTIRITREDLNGEDLTGTQQVHSSETALDDYIFDFIIPNNGTLQDLEDSAKHYYTRVCKRVIE
jgi:dephospho-CoA kinase